MPLWKKVGIGVGLVVALLVLVVLFFPWDLLRGPLNRYVSEKTGRRFEITRRLDVKPGLTTRVIADGLEFENPSWARDRLMVDAQGAEIDIKLLPLLRREIQLPRIWFKGPKLAFQMEADGKKSWALGEKKETGEPGTVPAIGQLLVDKGQVRFFAPGYGADIESQFSLDEGTGQKLPLRFDARGTWQKQPFKAGGATGSVLQISETGPSQRFPVDISASAGATSLKVAGSLAALQSLDGVDATFEIKGQTLDDMYLLLGVVLPNTPPYALKGRLSKQGAVWKAQDIAGRLGSTDLSGQLAYDQSATVAALSGKVQSNVLDFEDLGPLIGLDAAPKKAIPAADAATVPDAPSKANAKARGVKAPAAGKVLPRARLDLQKLRTMNADVSYDAKKVRHAREIPLDRMRLDVSLKNGDLRLDNLNIGIAGGTVTGSVHVDSSRDVATIATRLDARGIQLNQLVPAVESTKSSLGKLTGRIDLKGTGNSVAQMLGTASGDMALMMGRGEFSNFLLELVGLDGGEVIKFFVRGDRNVQLRCAAAAFDVKQGVMQSRAIVMDTSDTVITGSGRINLADETLDIVLKPAPKDRSFLSLRSPLNIGGTFASPAAGLDKSALAGRAGLALALGAINPWLALAATIETGPGVDADCQEVLKEAGNGKTPAAAAKGG